MRIFFLIAVTQFFVLQTIAQTSRALRVNLVVSPEPTREFLPNLAPPVIALQTHKNDQIRHVWELNRLELLTREVIDSGANRVEVGLNTRDFHLAVRYQRDYVFGQEEADWRPYIGFSTQLGIEYLEDRPYVSHMFPKRSTDIYLEIAAVPGVQARLSEKLAVYLSIPVRLARMGAIWQRNTNPLLSIAQQNVGSLELTVLPQPVAAFRIGLSHAI